MLLAISLVFLGAGGVLFFFTSAVMWVAARLVVPFGTDSWDDVLRAKRNAKKGVSPSGYMESMRHWYYAPEFAQRRIAKWVGAAWILAGGALLAAAVANS